MTAPTQTDPADRIRNEAARKHETIRGRQHLTQDARNGQHARAHLAAQDAMTTASEWAAKSDAANLADAKRRLYGNADLGWAGTDLAGQRDAGDRAAEAAASANPSALGALYDRAERNGDEVLARECGSAALDSIGHGDLAAKYLDARPAKAKAYADVQAHNQPLNAATMFQWILPTPPELSGMTESQMRQLAAGALPD